MINEESGNDLLNLLIQLSISLRVSSAGIKLDKLFNTLIVHLSYVIVNCY